jgi:hypothetical protein
MDKNITKKGLLALKDSKPVPITAHSHEIIVPCVYTETVKKMMKEKGIVLPLTPAKLAELRKIAKATPGQYKADPDEKAGGTSHAKGTTNVTVNIKNVIGRQGVRRRRGGRAGAGRSKIITARASGLIPAPSMHPGMVVNPNYNLIRPFVANTSMGFEPRPAPTIEHIKSELEKENALDRRLQIVDELTKQNKRDFSEAVKHIQNHLIEFPAGYEDPEHHEKQLQDEREKLIAHKLKEKEEKMQIHLDEPAVASSSSSARKPSTAPKSMPMERYLQLPRH